jgi:hypothetical protein
MASQDRKVFMSRWSKSVTKMTGGEEASVPINRASQIRRMNHLKDEVYREMLLLEIHRPGSEMGLALALLRAVVQSDSFFDRADFSEWLKTVCPLGLDMIEQALKAVTQCKVKAT